MPQPGIFERLSSALGGRGPATPASLRLNISPISQVGGRCVCQSAVAAQGGGTAFTMIVFKRHTYGFPLRGALMRSG